MPLFFIAWRNLLRRPTRSALTACGLGIAVAAVVALVGIADGFERSYIELLNNRRVDLIVHRSGGMLGLGRTLDYALADKLRLLPEVKEVLPGQVDFLALPKYDLYSVTAIGWERGSRLFNRLQIQSGRTLRSTSDTAAMIGTMLAQNTGKHPGDTLPIYGQQIEIAGIFESASIYENNAVVMQLGALQRLMNTDQVTLLSVAVDEHGGPAALRRVKSRIESLDRSLTVLPVDDFVKSIGEIQLAQAVAWVVSAIAIIIGAIGMLNTMIMSVAERVREIGVLRSIGWKQSRVVRLILSEGVMLSIVGAMIGIPAAALLAQFLSQFPLTAGIIEGHIAPVVMLKGLALAVIVGLLGAVYPAIWAARLRPVLALRR